MDDLQRIVPDKIQQLGNRKLLLVQGIIILVLVSLVVILLAVLGSKHAEGSLGQPPSSDRLVGQDATCATPDCLHMAGFLADNMDASIDPCEDFHSFACGGYRNRHHLAPDQDEVTMFQCMSEEVDEKLREMIENPTGGRARTPSEGKLRDFFLSCVHDYGRMKEGGRVLVNLIREKLGGWYVLSPDNWNQDWNVQEAMARVQGELLVNIFFEAYMERDAASNRNMLAMYPSANGMWYNYYKDDDTTGVRDAYQDYMRRVAILLLRDANVTLTPSDENVRIEQFVNDAFGMESQLTATMRLLQSRRLMYARETTTMGQIDRNFTQLDWMTVVTRMFEDLVVTDSTPVRLISKSYFAAVNAILQNETETHIKDRVLNNYMAWRIAHRYAADLSWEYREAGLRFLTAMRGEREWEPTWKTCLKTVLYRLGTLVATEFIRSHIAPDVKEQVNDMVSDIRSAIGQRILELHWMDNTTRQRAIEKINGAKAMIGFSEMYYNESLMEELHSMLEVDRSAGYFRNLLSLNKYQRRMRTRLLLDKETTFLEHLPLLGINFNYWVDPTFLVYYNTLLVPAGAMLDPMYNSRRPQIFNYGFLGTLIATELFESIGQYGRYMWTNGSYVYWWTNSTTNEFVKVNQCFVEYFSGITVGPFVVEGQNVTVPVSGNLQARRLMDDLAGIRAAFRAYKEWTKSNGDEALPVGHNLSRDQLFFLSSAQCADKVSDESFENSLPIPRNTRIHHIIRQRDELDKFNTKCFLRTDEESYQMARAGYLPEDIELNSLLSHMPEFTDAYQCPVGSKMRASYQCETF